MEITKDFDNTQFHSNFISVIDSTKTHLIELQTLRNENVNLRKSLSEITRQKNEFQLEIQNLKKSKEDSQAQLNIAYNVIQTFNHKNAENSGQYTKQAINLEASQMENEFLKKQVYTLQNGITQLTNENVDLTEKCRLFELNSNNNLENYTKVKALMNSLNENLKKLEKKQSFLESLVEKCNGELIMAREKVTYYKNELETLRKEKLYIEKQLVDFWISSSNPEKQNPKNDLLREILEKYNNLKEVLKQEKETNFKLIESLNLSVSLQNQFVTEQNPKTSINQVNSEVQTEFDLPQE